MGRAVLPLQRVDPHEFVITAFENEAIEAETCRFLILEWALKLPHDIRPVEAARVLLAQYHEREGHPMYQILLRVLADPPPAANDKTDAGRDLHQ